MFHILTGLVGDLTEYREGGPHSGLRVAGIYISAGILWKRMRHSAILGFERVTIYELKKIAVCQHFPNFSIRFPDISQLGNLQETNSHIPVVSISNPIRYGAVYPTTDRALSGYRSWHILLFLKSCHTGSIPIFLVAPTIMPIRCNGLAGWSLCLLAG